MSGRQRGFALLIVLWSVVLLSTVAATMVASARTDVQLARNLRSAAVVEAAADGAVYRAIFHLVDRDSRWPTDGRPVQAGAGLTVCIADEAGKINPNTASPGLLSALLTVLGADRTTAQRLAQAIASWHNAADAQAGMAAYQAAGLSYAPPGTPFLSSDDVRLVLGMTPALFARLRPNLTVWSDSEPNILAASPAVATALQQLLGGAVPAPIPGTTPGTVAITATALATDGARFTRQAVVRLAAEATQPPHVLDWTEGTPATTNCR